MICSAPVVAGPDAVFVDPLRTRTVVAAFEGCTGSLVTPSMLWTCLACCWTPVTSFASSSVWSDQPHSHSTRFCIPHLLERFDLTAALSTPGAAELAPKIIAGRLWRMFGGSLLR